MTRDGRETEFTRFAADSSRYLTRTAYLICGDPDLAADLVQEALLRTYAAWWRVRNADARGYARRVLVNLNIDRLRRPSARQVELFELADSTDPLGAVDDRDEVARMLASLGPQQRRVIVLRYYCDLSEAEVAASLGISVGAVKSASSRGLARLRARYASATEAASSLRGGP